MDANENITPPAAETPQTRRRSDKPRKKMSEARKADHHIARELVEKFFAANPEVAARWKSFYEGKQLRVISNLLLDYIPGFIPAFQSGATPELLAQCEELLVKAKADYAEYRRQNKVVVAAASN